MTGGGRTSGGRTGGGATSDHEPRGVDGPIRVVVWGLGAMGRLMARLVLADPDLCLVGAVSRRAARGRGTDVAELAGFDRPTGVTARATLNEVLENTGGADVVLHATGSFVRDVAPEIEACLENDLDVVTIAEEMAFPWARAPDLAERLGALAKERGRTVLGTGVNPGFVLDTLVIVLTAATGLVESIHARRVNDLAPYGPTVMRTQGVGLSPEEFERGVADGTVVGHIGFPESIHLIARALGVRVEAVEETRSPIVSKVRRKTPYLTVEPGRVAGCRHQARGLAGGRVFVELDHPQQVCPEAEGVKTGDFITIRGRPSLELTASPEIPGGLATAAMAVNMVRPVVAAPGGLLTMLDLPLPRGSARRAPGAVPPAVPSAVPPPAVPEVAVRG